MTNHGVSEQRSNVIETSVMTDDKGPFIIYGQGFRELFKNRCCQKSGPPMGTICDPIGDLPKKCPPQYIHPPPIKNE